MLIPRRLNRILDAECRVIRFWECSRCHWRYIPDKYQRVQDVMSHLLAKAEFDEHRCSDFEARPAPVEQVLERTKAAIVESLGLRPRVKSHPR